MKSAIHPKYYENAQVVCVCGNRFTVGATQELIHIELCNKCHPFYTGKQRFVDSASRIQKFQNKQQLASTLQAKNQKKVEEKKRSSEGPKSLREMLMGMK